MARSGIAVSLLVLTALVLVAAPAHAVRCLHDAGDAAQVVAARSQVNATCKCFGVARHNDYTRCAAGVVNERAALLLLRKECKGTVKKIYAQSVCGTDLTRAGSNGPRVPCVAENVGTGKVTCAIRPLFSCNSSPSLERDDCRAQTHCIDAADTNDDLEIGGPGDTGDCATIVEAFTDNGDGTVTDGRTGLTWEKLSNDGSLHDRFDFYGWDDAAAVKVAALNAGSFAGFSDWRVPTFHELSSLLRTGSSPAVPAEFDTGCAPGCTVLTCSCTNAGGGYWTTAEHGAQYAWPVRFGTLGNTTWDPKNFGNAVRAVRGGL